MMKIVIVGGGCAGVSLARALSATQRSDLRVTVLEPQTAIQKDRTWCFWDRGEDPSLRPLITDQWKRWSFSTGGRMVEHKAEGRLRYCRIPSERFYEQSFERLAADERVEVKGGVSAAGFSQAPKGGVVVQTSAGDLWADTVVDTRPPDSSALRSVGVWQEFAGVEVEFDHDVFDPECVGLMRDMQVDDLGFRFTYTLPFSRRKALVEETRFSVERVPRDRLLADLEETLNRLGPSWHVHRTEHGTIPMGPVRRSIKLANGVVDAGTRGGAVRPSTGYAFQRIQRWAQSSAVRVKNGLPLRSHPRDPLWRREMDRLFLQVLSRRKDLTPVLFMRLAEQMEPGDLVDFLCERGGLLQAFRVALSMPKGPFMREMFRSSPQRVLSH